MKKEEKKGKRKNIKEKRTIKNNKEKTGGKRSLDPDLRQIQDQH